MIKVVLKVDVHDEKAKQKAMNLVSCLPGINSISMEMKDKKMTVVGKVDPVEVVEKLRKLCFAEILTVGPPKEEEKDKKKPPFCCNPYYPYYPYNQHHPTYYSCMQDESPIGCVLC